MAYHNDYYQKAALTEQQPGLEYVQPGLMPWDEYDGGGKEPRPVAEHADHSYSPSQPHSQLISDAPEVVTSETGPREAKPKSRRRMIWGIGVLLVLVVVLAAVLGGVLGSRAGKSDSAGAQEEQTKPEGGKEESDISPSTTTPSAKNATATPRPKTLRKGSSLSVTGWRNTDGLVEKYLFFQTPQDGLCMMKCEQTKPGSNGTWLAPVSFNASAKPDTRLAAASIVHGTYFNPQIELFYTGKSSRLLGTSINDQTVPKFGDDSVNSIQIVTGINSTLSSYWPWTLQQDSDGTLVHVRNRLGGGFSPMSAWDINRIENVTALAGTSLAVVPMSSNFIKASVKGGYAVFYQAVDGRLSVEVTDLRSPDLEEDYVLSWPVDDLPEIIAPEKTPIAAFSVARGDGDKEERVNTYVLWIDGDSNINVLYTDTSSTSGSKDKPVWSTSRPKELSGVDEDSSLACLTMASSPRGPSGGPIPLEPGSEEIMRCYFMKGGQVVEAKLRPGKEMDWSIVGSLPIP